MSINETITTRRANQADVAALVEIVQMAYRGGLASVDWKNEHTLVTGPRIDESKMSALVGKQDAAVLTVSNSTARLCGCVLIEKHGNAVHVGMLAVHPDFQNMKLGKVLVEAAEKFSVEHFGAKTSKMFVLWQRVELLEWYVRLGYKKTGQLVPFPEEEDGSKPVQRDTMLLEIAKEL